MNLDFWALTCFTLHSVITLDTIALVSIHKVNATSAILTWSTGAFVQILTSENSHFYCPTKLSLKIYWFYREYTIDYFITCSSPPVTSIHIYFFIFYTISICQLLKNRIVCHSNIYTIMFLFVLASTYLFHISYRHNLEHSCTGNHWFCRCNFHRFDTAYLRTHWYLNIDKR